MTDRLPEYNDHGDSEHSAKYKLINLFRLHSYGPLTRTCTECGDDYPCQTVEIITQEL